MRFDGFVGNEQAKALLSAAVDGGRFPHALLIEGPTGSGKKQLAHLFAKAAVCLDVHKPCGVCSQCLKAETGHPDIAMLQGDGSAKSLSVDLIRDLREQASVVPNEAAYKVQIIADADCMNVQAQNALLKILEEPPSYMLFVLTATSRTAFLPTVQSRCVCLPLHGVTEEEALSVLQKQLPALPTGELQTRLRLYGGRIGAVLDSASDDSFQSTVERVTAIAAAITAPSELELMKATAPLEKDKPLTDAVLGGLKPVLRDALQYAAGGQVTVGVSPSAAKKLSMSMTKRQLLACMEAVEKLQEARKSNMNQTLLITLLCARLRAAAGR